MYTLRRCIAPLLLLVLVALYFMSLEADSIGGIFGIIWNDEGAYLASARHTVLFHNAHPFPHDQFNPEYAAPLLDAIARLVLSAQNTVWGIRCAVALLVVLGHGIIARMVGRHYQSTAAGYAAMALLLLSPLSFFYARTGLSEGIQYFLMACALWGLRQLWGATSERQRLGYSSFVAALIVTIFLAKITSISIALALSVGLLTLLMGQREQRSRALLVTLTVGLCTAGVLWCWWIGSHGDLWWQNNIASGVSQGYKSALSQLGVLLEIHVFGLHHFLTLMPVFILGFAALLMSADRRHGYIWLLSLMAMTTLAVEFFLGPELRRSFFGLSMLMVLAAFQLRAWLAQGIDWQRPWPRWRWPALLIIVAFVQGLALFIYRSFVFEDPVFTFAAPAYAVLFLIALLPGRRWRLTRQVVCGIIALCSLLPMLVQTMWPSYSIRHAEAAIEEAVPADAAITGSIVLWDFEGLKRQTISTRCMAAAPAGNRQEDIPNASNHYFLVFSEMVQAGLCLPPDFDQFQRVLKLRILKPINKGPGGGGSRHWRWYSDVELYHKP